ncbi:MAG: Cof-type HAD-IIB family hydrolase [Fretibacterium sp.]|nr:Cof-type HAD-IIB family hydrolase [Fretibacterium sp.]
MGQTDAVPLRVASDVIHNDIRIIAFDLDGTLLNSSKELSQADAESLARAAAAGVSLVPATGRAFVALPEVVRSMPFVRYVITANGAQVLDLREGISVVRAEIPLPQAIDILSYFDTLPVIYDCFMDGKAWMTRAFFEKIEDFAPDAHMLKMLRELRQPVDELKAFLQEQGRGMQKTQLFTWDDGLRAELLRDLAGRFPGTVVSSSAVNNVEINNEHANKGEALRRLADYLGVDMARTLAFGDGLNDVSMIRAAGVGVAMANASQEVRDAADFVTLSCDESGVSAGIKKYLKEVF